MNSRNSNPQGDSKLSANFWNNQAGDVSSRCRVLYRLRKSNIYKISFSITIFLKCENLRNIRIRICSYYFFKKSLIEDCFILSKILWFILFETFRSKGSRSKSVVNSVNLFRISIASSNFFCDFFGDMGLSGTPSSSLLPSSTVSIGCGRFSVQFRQQTMAEIRWWLPLYQNQRAHLHLDFQELSLV